MSKAGCATPFKKALRYKCPNTSLKQLFRDRFILKPALTKQRFRQILIKQNKKTNNIFGTINKQITQYFF